MYPAGGGASSRASCPRRRDMNLAGLPARYASDEFRGTMRTGQGACWVT